MAERFRIEFKDNRLLTWRASIYDSSFSGDYTSLLATGSPMRFSSDNNSDYYFDPIRETEVTINVYSRSDFALTVLYAIDNLKYPVEIYADEDLYFAGYLQPGNYREPYEPASYAVSLSAVCGLKYLKYITFDDNGEPYTGRLLESTIVNNILQKINCTIFNEGITIYETRIGVGPDESPMNQIYIDVSIFEGKTCYFVLQEILKKYGAVIEQIDGEFYIYRPADLTNSSLTFRRFIDGEYNNYTSIGIDQFIRRNSTHEDSSIRQSPGGSLMIMPPFAKVTINQDYGRKKSWIYNWELKGDTYDSVNKTWNGWTTHSGGLYIITNYIKSEKDGVAIPSSNTIAQYYITQEFASYAAITSTDYFVFSFDYCFYSWYNGTISNIELYIQLKDTASNKYLKGTSGNVAEWSDTAEFIALYFDVEYGLTPWTTSKWIFQSLPVAGTYQVTLYGAFSTGSTNFVVGYKNIVFASSSDEIAILPTVKKLWYYPTPKMVTTAIVIEPENEIEVTGRKYEVNNNITGELYDDLYLLGDVTDASITNIVEEFGGALAIVYGKTLSQVAAIFVSENADYYLSQDISLTSSGNVIRFECMYPGLYLYGSTIITNVSGDLNGTVQTIQSMVPGTLHIVDIELTGTNGNISITINGLTESIDFDTNLHNTAIQFALTYYPEYNLIGIDLSVDGNSIVASEMYPYGGFSASYVINSGDLAAIITITQQGVEGAAQIDTVTLSGNNGSATITCDGDTNSLAFVESDDLVPTEKWSRTGQSDNKELLSIIADEIGSMYSRPKQLIQLHIYETSKAIGLKLIKNIQDSINLYDSLNRCFCITRSEFDVRRRFWILDIFEIGSKADQSGESISADSTIITVDDTTITTDTI